MATAVKSFPSPGHPNLRPFDVRHDLTPVADLIELCFSDTLDLEGQQYLHQMRSVAQNARFLRWARDHSRLPLRGYVWDEGGRVVGNLSVIPLTSRGTRVYLIANVAVHPDFRQQGIARALTDAALAALQKKGRGRDIWLQVRAGNEPAFHLYTSVGFQERARRTVWHKRIGSFSTVGYDPEVRVRRHRSRDWTDQKAWLKRLYPPELAWNLHINLSAMQPGLMGALNRLATGLNIRQWGAARRGELLGVLSWKPVRSYPDRIWLAAPEGGEGLAIQNLLGPLEKSVFLRRALVLDFPDQQADETLEQVGFRAQHTLIWMQAQTD